MCPIDSGHVHSTPMEEQFTVRTGDLGAKLLAKSVKASRLHELLEHATGVGIEGQERMSLPVTMCGPVVK